jgi:hypothetical protein
MLDTIYKTVLTIMNKENQGYISPTEFNLIAHQVQNEIFRGYFEDENRDKNRQNRGLTNKGYSNLAFNQRHRITPFATISSINGINGIFTLPTNLYFIEDNGVTYTPQDSEGNNLVPRVIEEVERGSLNYLFRSAAAPTEVYPVFEMVGNTIRVYPNTIDSIGIRYLREPLPPNWTYLVVDGVEIYDPTNPSFRDFELHESEMPNIVLRIMSYFGINLREGDVVNVIESMLNRKLQREDN